MVILPPGGGVMFLKVISIKLKLAFTHNGRQRESKPGMGGNGRGGIWCRGGIWLQIGRGMVNWKGMFPQRNFPRGTGAQTGDGLAEMSRQLAAFKK